MAENVFKRQAMPDTPVSKICGLIMPISAIDGLSETHWSDVKALLYEAIEKAGFTPNLVSDAVDVGIIQKRIIQNLYDNPIVVCDVSGKNPNVMFELGMRLAFDKPTIIVKDDKTAYSFDTSPIEHLTYRRDLRYAEIVEFKSKLAEKIKATHDKAAEDETYTTFLKNFGEFTVAKLDKKEVPAQEFIIEELKALRLSIQRLDRASSVETSSRKIPVIVNEYKYRRLSEEQKAEVGSVIASFEPLTRSVQWRDLNDGSAAKIAFDANASSGEIEFVREQLASFVRHMKDKSSS
jgi:hypothetical protein